MVRYSHIKRDNSTMLPRALCTPSPKPCLVKTPLASAYIKTAAMYCAVLSFIFCLLVDTLVNASPLPTNSTVLEKRVTHSGRGTWYDPGAGIGHCGFSDKSASPVVAISQSLYNTNKGSNCNQWISITNKKNGKTAYGQTRDSCPGCGSNDLDLSPAVFQKLDSLSTGVIQIQWHFMNKGWKP
ncbi:hypothetical protein HGRIS_011214 [Hohenbuehelia grisea]|uniref:RlpA-like protein double-psi beta-barrel domain-containing protein n=1 Tax=Hohenbuehelia grisea TaxID=104357 RepID=A0ABR3JUH2_9AGAR